MTSAATDPSTNRLVRWKSYPSVPSPSASWRTPEAALIDGFEVVRAYFNIHTNLFPAGGIRGFLVPEPGALGFAAIGLIGLAVARRRWPLG